MKTNRIIYPRNLSSTRRLLASYLIRYQRKEVSGEELRHVCFACSKLKELDEVIEIKNELDKLRDEIEELN